MSGLYKYVGNNQWAQVKASEQPGAFWLLGLRREGRLRLLLAPLGVPMQSPAARWHEVHGRVDVDPLCAALRLRGDETETEAAGRAAAWDGHDWWPLPLPSGPRRVLLVGDQPSRRPLGPRALESASGGRLARIAGLTLPELLWTFETANAGLREAERVVARARGRRIVVLGEGTAAALDAAGLAHAGAVRVLHLPHPSGRSPLLNRLAVAREAALLLLAEAREARPRLPGRIHAAGLRGAWERLARHGVAALEPRGVPWVSAGLPGWWGSEWDGATLLAAAAAPHRWIVIPRQEGPVVEGETISLDAAQLLAELAARRLGLLDPWHALDARLAAA